MAQTALHDLEKIFTEATAQIANALSLEKLGDIKSHVLGKKSRLTDVMKTLGALAPEARATLGARVNEIKKALQSVLEMRERELKRAEVERQLAGETIDVTIPGANPLQGTHHPVMRVMEEARAIFRKMGFDICDGPEIETDYHNFEALNIPPDHPARDMQDTFYLPDGRLLRTHTSPVQVRVMQKEKPPIWMVAPGVVYRRDSDVTHTPMFHQIEALVVDEGIHMGHLKGVIREFLKKLFGRALEIRLRPSFFPFTEPSAEVDMTCVFCTNGCRICKHTRWLEIMGCGMVDPEVFRHCGVDAKRYTGFAFGLGIERVTMLKYGVNDLRLFFENDIRFLRQF